MSVTLSDEQYVALQDLVDALVVQIDDECGAPRCNRHENLDCPKLCSCGHPCFKHVSFGGWDEKANRAHDICCISGCQCLKFTEPSK